MAVVGRLVVVRPEGKSTLELHSDCPIRVGRSEGNEVRLAEKKASRFHAVFTPSGSGVMLSDLNSLNGTFVNNQRITAPVQLQHGDGVRIGASSFLVQLVHNGQGATPLEGSGETQAIGMEPMAVTILVADVVGYSSLAQRLPPEEVAKALEVWFSAVTRVVRGCGGEVDKYLGDAVLAVWRGETPQQSADTASRLALQAVNAAHQIHEETARMNCEAIWAPFRESPWRCRISLNSGQAMVGSLGASAVREFTVLGDSVNVAFRLNDVAERFHERTVLNSTTALLLRDQHAVTALGEVALEGRSGTTSVFALR